MPDRNKKLQIKCLTENETNKVINSLENKTSSGHDGISNKLFKSIQEEARKSLTLIINHLLATPSRLYLKNPKLCLFLKKGSVEKSFFNL